MRKYLPSLNGLVDKLEKKAHLKGKKVQKYQYLGLWIFGNVMGGADAS